VPATRIAAALAHEEEGRRPALKAQHGGYSRLDGASLCVIMDGAPPAGGPWSVTACAQTLAIEILAGTDRAGSTITVAVDPSAEPPRLLFRHAEQARLPALV
jgi:uncharacterized heparinase superfamily protein